MLVFKSLDELRAYLIARKEMASRQVTNASREGMRHAAGMVFAFDESIKALDAFINSSQSSDPVTSSLESMQSTFNRRASEEV